MKALLGAITFAAALMAGGSPAWAQTLETEANAVAPAQLPPPITYRGVVGEVDKAPSAGPPASLEALVRDRIEDLDALEATQSARNWRYRMHNGEWWYWTPAGQWAFYRDGQWRDYDLATYTAPYYVRPSYGEAYFGDYTPYYGDYYVNGRYVSAYGSYYVPGYGTYYTPYYGTYYTPYYGSFYYFSPNFGGSYNGGGYQSGYRGTSIPYYYAPAYSNYYYNRPGYPPNYYYGDFQPKAGANVAGAIAGAAAE
jgi:hypothetical protein